MDNVTKYYKNLAEKLSSELDILESCLALNEATDEELIQEGMRRALKKGTEESLSKEAMRQGERKKRKEDLARRAGEAYDRASRTKGPFSMEALKYAGLQNKASASARKLPQEIEHLDIQLSFMNPELAKRTSRKYMSQASLGDDPFPQRKMMEASHFKNETEYYKNLSEALKEKLNYLANVWLDEGSRPTMIPMTVAYDDGGDAPPNVATLRDDQEGDLSVDSFGGRYPNRAYMQQSKALDRYVKGFFDIGGELFARQLNAKKEALANAKYRGKPLSQMSPGSKTVTKFEDEFRKNYKDPQDLIDMRKGREEMIKITRNVLRADPNDKNFLDAEKRRIDVILGRRDSQGNPRNANAPFGQYTGD
jgi:hypothetical protein